MVPCLHQCNLYIQRKVRVWREQKCIPLVGGETPLTCVGQQITRHMGEGIGPRAETCVNLCGLIAMVLICTKTMFIAKGSYGYGENRNVFHQSVQKPHSRVRACKIPCLIGGGIGPRTETCVNWGGPIAMVPCLHQDNLYIQRKLRVWREQKCFPIVGGKNPCTSAGRQTTLSHGVGIRQRREICVNLGGLNAMGSMFVTRQYLYPKEATGKERTEMYSTSRWRNPTYLCEPSNYPVSWGAV